MSDEKHWSEQWILLDFLDRPKPKRNELEQFKWMFFVIAFLISLNIGASCALAAAILYRYG